MEKSKKTKLSNDNDNDNDGNSPSKNSQNQLGLLKSMTTVVADSGDILSIQQFKPQDATTNPSLIYQASQLANYDYVVKSAIEYGKKESNKTGDQLVDEIVDYMAVAFGCEILKTIPGRVSTEVDARLSFDCQASVEKARKLIGLYQKNGIDKSRVLIKLAATWEGIEAARILQKEGINCNMTLIFNFEQAVACADAGAFLISPFVGRILDWFKKNNPGKEYNGSEDPGVVSVAQIYNYYKKFDIKTIVMGASFRNIGELQQLAGCDYLTISPKLLKELEENTIDLPRKLDARHSKELTNIKKISVDEKSFRFALNEDAMATEKLAEGIRNFVVDLRKLEAFVKQKL